MIMKKLLLIMFVLAAGISSAQVTKNLGDFDQVKVFDRIQVNLVPSNENKAEVKGKRSGDVEFVNKNGQLKIRMKMEKLLDGENVNVTLYFKNLNDVDASEGALITTSSTIKTPKISITAKEGAEIELNLEVDNADVKSVTGGIIRLAGTSETMSVNIGTGGAVEAKPLKTAQTTVNISAGGEAEVYATNLVDANIKAGGNVKIYGHPKTINKKTTLGGTIEESE
jgi:hypothetical protein